MDLGCVGVMASLHGCDSAPGFLMAMPVAGMHALSASAVGVRPDTPLTLRGLDGVGLLWMEL